MAQAPSPNNELFFLGTSAGECEAFIRNVRKYAFTYSKQDDDKWLSDFVATCMDSDALRWYEDQTEEIQSSWRLLRKAMLANWPKTISTITKEASLEISTVPMPAAAPPPINRPFTTTFFSPSTTYTGLIRVVSDSQSVRGYISKNFSKSGHFRVTTSVVDALSIQFSPEDESHDIKIVNATGGHTALGVHWNTQEAEIEVGKPWCARHRSQKARLTRRMNSYAYLVGTKKSITGPSESSSTQVKGTLRTRPWTVSLTGMLSASRSLGGRTQSIPAVVVNNNDRVVCLWNDVKFPDSKAWTPVTLMIELTP